MNISVDGLNICYKITGSGDETVVMLQGWGTDLGVYDSVANAINEKYRFIQFDLPGFGGSDEPKEPWNIDAYADFFIKFMESLDIKKATLIGHSYGGRIIIKLAARESIPFEIKNIVLIDSAGVMPKRSFKQKFNIRKYKIIKKIVSVKLIYALFPELIDDWRSSQGSADYRNASPMMRQCMVMAVNEDLTDLLPKIKQDTLLIWGDKDTATPISDGRLMEERIPNSGLAVLPGCGHFSFLENPAVFKSIMRSFFNI
ncbi:MAG: alpha/beta hydrolase [Lachnospiraceae bacterium]|nr:alpha/beta hydrolase [Lachnospiraceae bacterium]MBR5765359.1 alpha/beta hydrolase [Lachnospiraceae bacterium]MBR6486658.1 alpha/beta hydrolase [Lachnospiraceae bacterium]